MGELPQINWIPILPAIASAIAAIFSALAASITARTNVRNANEAIKPILVLDGWSLDTEKEDAPKLKVKKVENVGKGPALHLYCDLRYAKTLNHIIRQTTPSATSPKAATAYHKNVTLLLQNSERELDLDATFRWPVQLVPKAVSGEATYQTPYKFNMCDINLLLYFCDIRGNRHNVTYELHLTTLPAKMVGYEELTKGVQLIDITHSTSFLKWGWKGKYDARQHERKIRRRPGLYTKLQNIRYTIRHASKIVERAKKKEERAKSKLAKLQRSITKDFLKQQQTNQRWFSLNVRTVAPLKVKRHVSELTNHLRSETVKFLSHSDSKRLLSGECYTEAELENLEPEDLAKHAVLICYDLITHHVCEVLRDNQDPDDRMKWKYRLIREYWKVDDDGPPNGGEG